MKRAAFDREVNRAKAEASSAGPIEDARQKQAIVRERTKQQKVEEEIKLEIADQIVERTKKEKEGEKDSLSAVKSASSWAMSTSDLPQSCDEQPGFSWLSCLWQDDAPSW